MNGSNLISKLIFKFKNFLCCEIIKTPFMTFITYRRKKGALFLYMKKIVLLTTTLFFEKNVFIEFSIDIV